MNVNKKSEKILPVVALIAGFVAGFAMNVDAMIFSGAALFLEKCGSFLYLAAWLYFARSLAAKSTGASVFMLVSWLALPAVWCTFSAVHPLLPDVLQIGLALFFTPLYGTGLQDVGEVLPVVTSIVFGAVFAALAVYNLVILKKNSANKKEDNGACASLR